MEMTSNSGSKMATAVYTQCVNSVNPKPVKCPGALPCGPVAPCQSGPVGAMIMQSHVAVVGDASHPRPFKGALGMMWRSGYLGFDVHRQQNRDVWSDRCLRLRCSRSSSATRRARSTWVSSGELPRNWRSCSSPLARSSSICSAVRLGARARGATDAGAGRDVELAEPAEAADPLEGDP